MRVIQWELRDRLRKAREAAGLSQKELAEQLHVSRVTISNAERGTRIPLKSTIVAWAKICEVDLDWLIQE